MWVLIIWWRKIVQNVNARKMKEETKEMNEEWKVKKEKKWNNQ